jgi:predicted RNA methylase
MEIKEKINAITAEYLKDNIYYPTLLQASRDLKATLGAIAGTLHDSLEGKEPIYTENGKALGPHWAILCIDDLMRTRQFTRGVFKAMDDKLKTKEHIHVLYAGTGPFATLILPVIFRFPKESVKYTLMEINPLTFDSLKTVVSAIGMDSYNIELVMADATHYQFSEGAAPDIIISETMQNFLANEQQVSIFINLMRQAGDDTLFIPEKINVSASLSQSKLVDGIKHDQHYTKIASLFEVSREALHDQIKSTKDDEKEVTLAEKQIALKEPQLKGYDSLALVTEIQVYGDEHLLLNQSGLTVPKFLLDLRQNRDKGISIKSCYKIDQKPRLEYKVTLV